jgi:Na+-driven multidrug efflux pump
VSTYKLTGSAIPIACSGIAMKTSQLFFSVVIGIAQGSQPIESFNYGAKNYERVKKALALALCAGGCVSMLSFIVFQTMPRQILALFGNGTEEYFTFGVMFMRRFLFAMFLNFIQPITSTFFTSIGKPIKGVFLSMTRQIIFLLPLIVLFPLFMGIDGIVYAGPVADFLAAVISAIMLVSEFKKMGKLDMTSEQSA